MTATANVLDFSFLHIADLNELPDKLDIASPPPANTATAETSVQRKVKAHSVRLASNKITDLGNFSPAVHSILTHPRGLRWIDLSFNELTSIGDSLSEFTELSVLYMHANKIESFKALKPLANLPKLRSITLHGNPIEDKPGYRYYLIHFVPSLNQINFSPVTRQDREGAKAWAQTNRRQLGLAPRD